MINEREAALNMIMSAESGKNGGSGYNNKDLGLQRDTIDLRGRGFINEITSGTARRLIYIDYVIDRYSKIKTADMRPFVRALLRMTAYQLLFLNKVPASAAINEAVNLAKKRGYASLSGFCNGVLRNIHRGGVIEPLDDDLFLSRKYSYSPWLADYFVNIYGREAAEQICAASLTTPDVHICANTLKVKADELMLRFPNSISTGANGFLTPHMDIAVTEEFKKGLFHVMDYSSMRAVEALDPQPGDTVLDLCAAPGGKSFYSAYKMNNIGRIFAFDASPRLDLMSEQIERLNIRIIQTQRHDSRTFMKDLIGAADRVLVDAPCTGFGVARRKPEIKYNRQPGDILRLAQIQSDILKNAWQYLKPGGRLVYATCTLTREENSDNARELQNTAPLILNSESLTLPRPDSHEDGFYIAVFKRKEK
jgi:16S rRNA (cytosine967-C5)-methyltransferase